MTGNEVSSTEIVTLIGLCRLLVIDKAMVNIERTMSGLHSPRATRLARILLGELEVTADDELDIALIRRSAGDQHDLA
jgi:hypothetical protein